MHTPVRRIKILFFACAVLLAALLLPATAALARSAPAAAGQKPPGGVWLSPSNQTCYPISVIDSWGPYKATGHVNTTTLKGYYCADKWEFSGKTAPQGRIILRYDALSGCEGAGCFTAFPDLTLAEYAGRFMLVGEEPVAVYELLAEPHAERPLDLAGVAFRPWPYPWPGPFPPRLCDPLPCPEEPSPWPAPDPDWPTWVAVEGDSLGLPVAPDPVVLNTTGVVWVAALRADLAAAWQAEAGLPQALSEGEAIGLSCSIQKEAGRYACLTVRYVQPLDDTTVLVDFVSPSGEPVYATSVAARVAAAAGPADPYRVQDFLLDLLKLLALGGANG